MEHFPRYWPFVLGIHMSPVNSPHKGQWRGALMFSLICTWTNGWVNNRDAGDFRRHCAHYYVTIMCCWCWTEHHWYQISQKADAADCDLIVMEVIHGSLDWTDWQRAFCPPSFFSMTLHFLSFGLWSPALEITYSSYELLLIMSYNGIEVSTKLKFVILFLANGWIESVTTWGLMTCVARMTKPFTWIQKHSHENSSFYAGGKKSGAYLSKSLPGVVVGTHRSVTDFFLRATKAPIGEKPRPHSSAQLLWVYTLNKWVCWWFFFYSV